MVGFLGFVINFCFVKEERKKLRKSLKRMSEVWDYEMTSDMSKILWLGSHAGKCRDEILCHECESEDEDGLM